MSDRPPPNTPVQAKAVPAQAPKRTAQQIHDAAMKRPAETLHLAKPHLNPHRGPAPQKDQS